MRVPTLLAATTTSWLGTARIPKVLFDAGFEVSLLSPRNSLAEFSRDVARRAYVPDSATAAQWLEALVAITNATSPRLLIPCDDMAFRLLASAVAEPPQGMRANLHSRVAELIQASLGNPVHYQASVDKTTLPQLAETLGVRVPPNAIVGGIGNADPFLARYGYPVVLKRPHDFAGQGVRICANRSSLGQAFDAFAMADAREMTVGSRQRYLLQAHVEGPVQYFHAAAWQGTLLAGWALQKLIGSPEPTGPPTVTRYFRGMELRAIAAELARALGISGFFFAEFIVEASSGIPYLLEINRRVSPATHRGAARDVDLCAALAAAIHGTPSKSRVGLDEGEEGITVHFPQEWLRDPRSEALSRFPSDVPWDEPELFEALLRLRH